MTTSRSKTKVFMFQIPPVAASRPRVGRRATYYTGPYQRFRVSMGPIVERVVREKKHKMWVDTALECECVFSVPRPGTTKLGWPDPDIDNYIKAILDQLNNRVFDDDRCIVTLKAKKYWSTDGKPLIALRFTEIGPYSVKKEATKRKRGGKGAVSNVPKQARGRKR